MAQIYIQFVYIVVNIAIRLADRAAGKDFFKILKMKNNVISNLLGIRIPIIQAGMVWCSGWKLASEVSNAGGLGLIGSGSMYPETLRDNIQKCKNATKNIFGVNIPLMYSQVEDHIKVILEENVKVVFTSAGNPAKWTRLLQENGITVVHVVSSVKFAIKCQEAGVDAVVTEGFEAGGHNGKEENTTFCLVPMVREAIDLPLIAAGGIGTGRGMFGAMALGADGVQVGSRFAISNESTAHKKYKTRIIESGEGETGLVLKDLAPVRLLKNRFYEEVHHAEKTGVSIRELKELLGRGRAKKGILEGNLEDGEIEIGQISASINEIKGAREIVNEIWNEYQQLVNDFYD